VAKAGSGRRPSRRRLARDGFETLVVSTDPAYSLGDAIEQSVG